MYIIISPAKRMREDTDALPTLTMPAFPEKTEKLLQYLRALPPEELRALLACNEKIAAENYQRFSDMNPARPRTPAVFAYQGIQYQYMAPTAFTDREYEYVQAHLRILSGFYGMLRPFDGIYPYRLEMQAKLRTDFCSSLYDFWGDDMGKALTEKGGWVLDLSSEEYSRAARQGADPEIPWISVRFGEVTGGKIREKGTQCKMARGSMVRYLAERSITDPEGVKEFDQLNYRFDPERSSRSEYVFIKG